MKLTPKEMALLEELAKYETPEQMARLQMAAEYELPFEVKYWISCARSIEICFEWKDSKKKYSLYPSALIRPEELQAGALRVICGSEITEFEKELIDRVFHMAHEAGRFTGNE